MYLLATDENTYSPFRLTNKDDFANWVALRGEIPGEEGCDYRLYWVTRNNKYRLYTGPEYDYLPNGYVEFTYYREDAPLDVAKFCLDAEILIDSICSRGKQPPKNLDNVLRSAKIFEMPTASDELRKAVSEFYSDTANQPTEE